MSAVATPQSHIAYELIEQQSGVTVIEFLTPEVAGPVQSRELATSSSLCSGRMFRATW